MSSSQSLCFGNNRGPDPGPEPGPDPGTGTNTGTSTGTDSTPQGSYWRVLYGLYEPRYWVEPGKLLCDCPSHDVSRWPTELAELTIASCAYRCPYCDEFNKNGRTRLMASNLRRHITKTHIGNAPVYGTLVVAPGWKK
ncbi:unnamed protein product [Penicillium egyptiacum]|uniref:Uncharacterized protein n=1 Tax=Penicillium egyptiacum TaxID=1303716 RepID=A0A9W4KMY1_9EURO|nr:unnamed protein product [Penicillium egyptiacum]